MPGPCRFWIDKFRDAFHGVRDGVRGQSSFAVHFAVAIAVVAAGAALGVDHCQWCLLVLCMAGVICAELFNTALESLAKAVSEQSHPHVGRSLDIAAAAVLVSSLGAALVGTTIFIPRIAGLFVR
jgi:diacylglycerol kinase